MPFFAGFAKECRPSGALVPTSFPRPYGLGSIISPLGGLRPSLRYNHSRLLRFRVIISELFVRFFPKEHRSVRFPLTDVSEIDDLPRTFDSARRAELLSPARQRWERIEKMQSPTSVGRHNPAVNS